MMFRPNFAFVLFFKKESSRSLVIGLCSDQVPMVIHSSDFDASCCIYVSPLSALSRSLSQVGTTIDCTGHVLVVVRVCVCVLDIFREVSTDGFSGKNI